MDDYLKKTIDVYNKVADEYTVQSLQKIPAFQRKKFLSFLPQKAVVLDLGCGSGRDCKYFIDHACTVIGIDLSERLLEIAQKQAPQAKFLLQDIRNITLPPESIDGVWACASLLHIKRHELPSVFETIYTILRSGGIFFIEVKKGKGEVERIDPSTPGLRRLFILYEPDELELLLKQAGFHDISCYESFNQRQDNIHWISCFAKKAL